MTKEIWIQSTRFPSYEVSNLGRVRNFNTKQIKALTIDKDSGYVKVKLGKSTVRLHRLIAEEFIENTYNKAEVNHIDGNKQNNAFYNLEWMTREENAKHSFRPDSGRKMPSRKMTPSLLTLILKEYKCGVKGCGAVSLARKYGLTQQIIRYHIKKRIKEYNNGRPYQEIFNL